jgi:hypothetical protein
MLTSVVYADGFGGVGTSVTVEAVKVDPAGNTYITGSFTGTVSFGGFTLTSLGQTNAFVAQINRAGFVTWAKRMGSANPFDGDFGRGLGIDAAGDVYVTGFVSAQADFGPFTITPVGGRDAYVTKLDNNGHFLWVKDFGGNGNDLGQNVAVDAAGNAVATGSFQGSATFGGVTLTSAGSNDIYVAKLDPSGNVSWAKSMGGSGDDDGFSVALDASGNVYTTGIFSATATFGATTLTSAGATDIFVVKLDASGNVLWADPFGGPGLDNGTSIAVDNSGNVYLTGDFVGTAQFGSVSLTSLGGDDAFIARLDGTGKVLWAESFGGSQADAGFGITTDLAGNVYDTGVFHGAISIGAGGVLQSLGGYDVYLLKLNPTGTVLSGQSFGSTTDDQAFAVAVGGPTNRIALVGNVSGAALVSGVALPQGASGYLVQLAESPVSITLEPPSDFDGTGRTQVAIFRPTFSQWFAMATMPIMAPHLVATFGGPNLLDVPIPGDYDGVGRTEPAVYRPSTAQWFVLRPGGVGHQLITFGAPNLYDIPVPANYDGLNHTEVAIFRPATSEWFVVGPNGGYRLAVFGAPNLTDIPVPGDYDGVGYAEPAVFRPSTSEWFVLGPNGGHKFATFGAPNLFDIPIPGDYDGVGHIEPAVFRPSTGQFFVLGTLGGHPINGFGALNLYDLPTQANAAALMKLGLIGGGMSKMSIGFGPGTNALAIAPSAAQPASPVPSGPASALTPPVELVSAYSRPARSRSARDLWSVALEEVAGQPRGPWAV